MYRYKNEGFEEPLEVIQSNKQYNASIDSIQYWIDETLEITDSDLDFVTLKELWSNYKQPDMYDKKLKMKEFSEEVIKKTKIPK